MSHISGKDGDNNIELGIFTNDSYKEISAVIFLLQESLEKQ